jgi:hypothetical protein
MEWHWIAIIVYAVCFVAASLTIWFVVKDDEETNEEGTDRFVRLVISLLSGLVGPISVLLILVALMADGIEAVGKNALD